MRDLADLGVRASYKIEFIVHRWPGQLVVRAREARRKRI